MEQSYKANQSIFRRYLQNIIWQKIVYPLSTDLACNHLPIRVNARIVGEGGEKTV